MEWQCLLRILEDIISWEKLLLSQQAWHSHILTRMTLFGLIVDEVLIFVWRRAERTSTAEAAEEANEKYMHGALAHSRGRCTRDRHGSPRGGGKIQVRTSNGRSH